MDLEPYDSSLPSELGPLPHCFYGLTVAKMLSEDAEIVELFFASDKWVFGLGLGQCIITDRSFKVIWE